MSYSTVMVHVDLGSSGSMAERRVKLAGSLAGRFDARLIGVAAQPCFSPSRYCDRLRAGAGGE